MFQEGIVKRKFDLSSLSIDELWALHEEVGARLSEKIIAEKRGLEERLSKLKAGARVNRRGSVKERRPKRRQYPPVLPKYQNPHNLSETWAGRGKQPRWLVGQIRAGKKIDDFLIDRAKRRTVKRRSA
jgi:DNA-binding protein H-NS